MVSVCQKAGFFDKGGVKHKSEHTGTCFFRLSDIILQIASWAGRSCATGGPYQRGFQCRSRRQGQEARSAQGAGGSYDQGGRNGKCQWTQNESEATAAMSASESTVMVYRQRREAPAATKQGPGVQNLPDRSLTENSVQASIQNSTVEGKRI